MNREDTILAQVNAFQPVKWFEQYAIARSFVSGNRGAGILTDLNYRERMNYWMCTTWAPNVVRLEMDEGEVQTILGRIFAKVVDNALSKTLVEQLEFKHDESVNPIPLGGRPLFRVLMFARFSKVMDPIGVAFGTYPLDIIDQESSHIKRVGTSSLRVPQGGIVEGIRSVVPQIQGSGVE